MISSYNMLSVLRSVVNQELICTGERFVGFYGKKCVSQVTPSVKPKEIRHLRLIPRGNSTLHSLSFLSQPNTELIFPRE